MTTLTKRVTKRLTPIEQFVRDVDRAKEIMQAAHERANSEFLARVDDARSRLTGVGQQGVSHDGGATNKDSVTPESGEAIVN